MDILAQILFYSAFLAPIAINIAVLKFLKYKTWIKLVIGFVISILVIFLLFYLSMLLAFKDGMGPT